MIVCRINLLVGLLFGYIDMNRFICLLFALLLIPPSSDVRYYSCVIYQDNRCYQEYVDEHSFCEMVRDFYRDSSIESLFITRDL